MANNKPVVVVTGAHGFLGSTLVSHFAGLGWNVIALVRNPPSLNKLENVRYVAYDMTRLVDPSVFKNADYLVHAAYIRLDRQNPNAFELNLKAAKDLISASRAAKLKKNLFMSSMSAHDEAVSTYGRQKLAIEKVFNGPRDVNLRSGLIIGNGGIVKTMSDFMKSKHAVPLIAGGKQPLQIIGVDDLAKVIEKSLRGKAHGTFTVAHPKVYTYKRFYKLLARNLKTKVLFIPVPFYALLYMIRFINLLHLPLAVSEDNLWGLAQLRSFDTAKDLKKIGVQVASLEELLK
ncbi:MAG TPA: NAD-dependent epimerase/dehydratase family protein [Candidatus Saccharimonadales bacterium]|nr:NAD-dependent epimerase/dehydratase family protein [Candidatus Saccharimonadales bacterium]